MSQNRDAPAYQEYAATTLSQLPFRTMTLQDRGLLYTMRLECWVNVRLPHNHIDLAKVLGLPIEEVAGSLAAVMPFFEVVEGFVISPELENYRAYLADRKNRQRQGGELGSAITNKKRNRPEKTVDEKVASTSLTTPSSTQSTNSSSNPSATPSANSSTTSSTTSSAIPSATSSATSSAIPSSNLRLPRRGEVESLVQSSTEKQSQDQSLKKGVVVDSFVAEYEAAERKMANDYFRASRGDE